MPIIVLGEKLYSIKETSEMLAVTPRTMQNYASTRKIKGRKIAGSWRFTEDEIRTFIDTREPEPPTIAPRAVHDR